MPVHSVTLSWMNAQGSSLHERSTLPFNGSFHTGESGGYPHGILWYAHQVLLRYTYAS